MHILERGSAGLLGAGLLGAGHVGESTLGRVLRLPPVPVDRYTVPLEMFCTGATAMHFVRKHVPTKRQTLLQ